MRLEKDTLGDLVTDDNKKDWDAEFRKRDWGFYYIDENEDNIKLMRVINPTDWDDNSKYYL